MIVKIYRTNWDKTNYHVRLGCSSCDGGPSHESPMGEVEMSLSVCQALEGKFPARGYVLVPDEINNDEPASDWWSVVFMLTR
jgi:hypothetical protein